MHVEKLNRTLDDWINALATYSFHQLCIQPAPGSWSIGQLYTHLVTDGNYYLEQMNICLSTNNHAEEKLSPAAEIIFLNQQLPDELIEGSPSNAFIPQPESKEQFEESFLKWKDDMNGMAIRITSGTFKGKTKHPGLNYFSAAEWFLFAEMHLRHHLRQRKGSISSCSIIPAMNEIALYYGTHLTSHLNIFSIKINECVFPDFNLVVNSCTSFSRSFVFFQIN